MQQTGSACSSMGCIIPLPQSNRKNMYRISRRSWMSRSNPTISFNDVMVLCAINYMDAYKRSEENADRMRSQITEYLEDAAKARIELDEVKRENAHLRRQLDGQELKGQIKDMKV